MAADMQNGAFRQDNMEVPKGDRVLPMFSLKGRTAIVSGAGAGIGLAAAQAFAEAGANVAIWYNSNKQALKEAENIEKTYGVKCTFFGVPNARTRFGSLISLCPPCRGIPPCRMLALVLMI